MISFYLFRSLKRRPLRHFSLFWVMMCAFFLPLAVSIYRDSLMYGSYLQKITKSKGQAIHIRGVQPEDVDRFRGIEDLTEPYYEDGTIYLNYASEEAWERYSDSEERGVLLFSLRARLKSNGRDLSGIEINTMSRTLVNGELEEITLGQAQKMRITCFALLLFSGLIVWNAYRNHIVSFSEDMAHLSAIGATSGQIRTMFLLELGIIFPLAAGCSVGISYGIMRVLYRQFMERTTTGTIVWQIFRMDPVNTALLIGSYLVVCLAALRFALLKKPRQKRFRSRKKPASFPRRWIQQTHPPFWQGCLILIPIIAVFVVLFNQYLNQYASYLQSAQEVTITISPRLITRGFRQEEMNFISSFAGIQKMDIIRDESYHYSLYGPDGWYICSGNMQLYIDYAPGEPDLEKYQFMANIPAEYASEDAFQICQPNDPRKKIDLYLVSCITPAGSIPGPLDFYISQALMDEIAADAPIRQLKLHTTLAYSPAMEEALGAEGYSFSSTGANDLSVVALSEGHLWMLSWIFCILMLVAMQIVWMQLSAYVHACAPMLKTVQQLGASRRQLARLIPAWRAGIAVAVVPFLIAVPYTLVRGWFRVGQMGNFIISLPLVGIYGGIALLAMATFLLPVKVSLRKILKSGK